MNVSQKIVIITTGAGGTAGLNAVNQDLQQGWRVMQISPMGGAGGGEGVRFAAAVLLEQSEGGATRLAEEMEKQAEVDMEGQIEQALEGGYIVESETENGGWANPDLD